MSKDPTRFKAPKHVTEIFTPSGPKAVGKNGIVELATDAPMSDHHALRAAGCEVVRDGEEAPAEQDEAVAPRGRSK